MPRKIVSATMLFLLAMSMLTLAFKIQIVKANAGTIHKQVDGSMARSSGSGLVPTSVFTADAGSAPEVRILPQNITGFNVGDNFTVSVTVENVSPPNSTYDGVFAAEVHLLYNPRVLNATSLTEGTFLTSVRPTVGAQLYSEQNWSAKPPTAEVSYSASLTDGPPPDASGSGILLNVTFQVVSEYSTELNLIPYVAGSGEPGTYFLTRDFVEVIPELENASYFGVQPGFNPIHNLSTGLNYTTIQEAINAPETLDGNTILVDPETYYEDIFINKSVNLIGENKTNTIIDGYGAQWVVSITSNNVSFSGFTVENGGNGLPSNIIPNGGILLASNESWISDNLVVNNNYIGILNLGGYSTDIGDVVENNVVRDSWYGIFFAALDSKLLNNTIVNCTWEGVQIYGQDNVLRQNRMLNNTLCDFGAQGIQDIDETNLVNGKPIIYWINQSDKEVPSNAGYVACINCVKLTIANVVLGKVTIGIELINTNSSVVTNDIILNCSYASILLSNSYGNLIANCSLTSNTGRYEDIIEIDDSGNNTITQNLIEGGNVLMNGSSYGTGIDMQNSNGNMIYRNNFVNNGPQVYSYNSTNTWDDGYPSGGNYWSDYSETDVYSGPYQNLTGSDGIGDTPYAIDSNNIDHYPLANPAIIIPPQKLVGDLNGDGMVSLQDLQLLAKAYDSKHGDSNWNPNADLAPPYGIISLTDLVTMAFHYGQHSP